jgi:lantibiotic biosynthesis protein
MHSDQPAFLELAARFGHEIAASAIWSGGRCNWVGTLPHDEAIVRGRAEMAALGPDLYGGTSGVALFLAEAGVRLDDVRLRATALGAIRLALEQAGRIDPQLRDGLYGGSIGIAYAAARVAGLLGAEEVHANACEVLQAWRRNGTRSGWSDLMSGCAGAVVGLIALSPQVADQWLVDAAAGLGDELIARADVSAGGWSWSDPQEPSMYNLCGYVHGAAGVGHALGELFGATGDGRFREAAERAFDYERSWFDTSTATWPDLRGVARTAGRDAPVPAASPSWCNGALGITLARRRAAELFASEPHHREAGVALAECERHVGDLLVSAPDDFSLCHGAAGAADVLLHTAVGRAELARQLGRRGIELYAGPAARFPCGVPLGETPGLLLGSAGIGMLYLRLVHPTVQSPLLIHRPQA